MTENGVKLEEGLGVFKSDNFDVQYKCSLNEKCSGASTSHLGLASPTMGLHYACEPILGVASRRSRRTQARELGFVKGETLSLSTSLGLPSLDLSRPLAREHGSLGSRALGCSRGQIWGLRAMGSCGGVVATIATIDGRRSGDNDRRATVAAKDIFGFSHLFLMENSYYPWTRDEWAFRINS
ncbi:hypothetical protein CRG98_026044 [Punica granatum]|uniref:Uncharacterized protein n=1 Tax=Punica granatum TaxID=22663 RepID=A0A2I0JBJ5_PUNGR|nr:hypothetical protein CRG98_026044 [Punica granatum]